jgi:hypothetical protein
LQKRDNLDTKEILREIDEYQQLYTMEEQHTPSWKDPTTSQNNFNPTKKKEKQIHLQTRMILLTIEVETSALAGIHATLEKLYEEVAVLTGSLEKFSSSKEKTRHSQPR